MIRTKLSKLVEYWSEIKNGIVKFNGHAKELMDSLSATDKIMFDVLVNLFKAMFCFSLQEFVLYISGVQTKWELGIHWL